MILDAYCQGWPVKLKEDPAVTVSYLLYDLWRRLMSADTARGNSRFQDSHAERL
jgi:hypothetical protein